MTVDFFRSPRGNKSLLFTAQLSNFQHISDGLIFVAGSRGAWIDPNMDSIDTNTDIRKDSKYIKKWKVWRFFVIMWRVKVTLLYNLKVLVLAILAFYLNWELDTKIFSISQHYLKP